MKTIYRFLLLLAIGQSASTALEAQMSRRDTRRYNKAESRYEKQEYDAAEKLAIPLSKKYASSTVVWELIAKIQVLHYYRLHDNDPHFSVQKRSAVDSITGLPIPFDSAAEKLADILNSRLPSSIYLQRALNTWREATLKCPEAELPSLLLRRFLIEPAIADSSDNPNALREFQEGGEAYARQNFSDAIIHYQKATNLDTTFYKARLLLGESYLSKQDYVFASHCFRELILQHPHRQEPRKYLVDALCKMEAYEEARKELIDALLLYPDAGLLNKLSAIARVQQKSFDRHWMERVVFPNTVGDQPLNEKGDRDWMEYINGFSLIEKYCNKDGIIVKKNDLTQSHYAEVFSWEYMLSKTDSDKFPFARQMQQAGYLDCYVMLSEYHIDFHAQYRHFARHNKERLKGYVDLLMER
jgi:tetratricopeptide (TPR) repeat protein